MKAKDLVPGQHVFCHEIEPGVRTSRITIKEYEVVEHTSLPRDIVFVKSASNGRRVRRRIPDVDEYADYSKGKYVVWLTSIDLNKARAMVREYVLYGVKRHFQEACAGIDILSALDYMVKSS